MMPVLILLLLGSAAVLVSIIVVGSSSRGKSVRHKIPAKLPSYEWIGVGRGAHQKKWTYYDKVVQEIQQEEQFERKMKKAHIEKKHPSHDTQD